MLSLLIVDDERGARHAMRRALEKEGYKLQEAPTADEALEVLKHSEIDLVFLDVQMPGMDGMTALGEIVKLPSAPLVVMVTAFGSEKLAVEAIKRGAYDYVAKPYDVEELRLLVRRAIDRVELHRENRRLKEELSRVHGTGEISGNSPALMKVFDRIDKVGPTDVTVLITGESGTGKELVARAIHRASPRAKAPWVVFDCSNVDKALIRSELFGHEKGAYTGADSERSGAFERAAGGTLFIDEIGELDAELQPRLLRVLETREVLRLGSDKPHRVDVRVVAATNRDLDKLVRENQFRQDLFFRLSVVTIRLPPLRERPEDIPLLAQRFLDDCNQRFKKSIKGFSPLVRQLFHENPWLGNVRELRNAIESAAVLADGDVLTPEDFPSLRRDAPPPPGFDFAPFDAKLPYREAKGRLIAEFERRYIREKLRLCGGNVSRAARELGMHRQSLQQKLKALGIREAAEEAPGTPEAPAQG